MRRMSSNSESGAILLIVIILMLALTITGIAFLNAGVMENRLVGREVYKNKAFYVAEGGLERTIWNLKQDFENGSGDWTDGTINNEISVGPAGEGGWRPLIYDQTLLGDGSYAVKLKYVYDAYDEVTGEPIGPPRKDRIWVRSTGTVEDVPRTVEVYVKVINLAPWNTAIFGGTGSVAGMVIEGSAKIHGSVRVLGEELPFPTDLALDFSGDAGIRNNYDGMPPELRSKVPYGDNTYTLDATLHVKRGKVGLSGSATVGEPEASSSFKEKMDGVYVCVVDETSGYRGNQGVTNVYSDNDPETPYDPSDTIEFPKLTDPYIDPATEEPYYNPNTMIKDLTYLEYLDIFSLKITEFDEISSEYDIGYTSQTSTDDDPVKGPGEKTTSSIEWHWYPDQGKGILEVEGVVWVESSSLQLGKKNERIEYRGNGIIVVGTHDPFDPVDGVINVVADLVAEGDYPGDGFPKHVLGLIANNIYLAPEPCDSQLTMTGAFYAQNQIFSAKQNEIAGTFVSNVFDMGGQVPRIYQVPELQYKVPPGMPGGTPIWYITTSQWSES